MKTELIDSISKMVVNGIRLELPKGDMLENYAAVKKALIDAGGKYKRCGFEFSDDAQDVKDRLIGGEAINDKKKYQFFATQERPGKRVIELAEIRRNHIVLEPSAGQAHLANLVRDIIGQQGLLTVELMEENIKALQRQGYDPIHADFLVLSPDDLGLFDRIIANPPFTKNQDVDHIKHMYTFLKPKGRLVSIAGKSWTFGSQKKQIAFREWLEELDAYTEEIPAGEFKESGTNISSMIIVINKS